MTLLDQATDADDLRQKTCEMLKKAVPANGLSSDDPKFAAMTGLNSQKLRANWKGGGNQTSCNSFAGWVAQQIGAKVGSAMCSGKLDLSGVEKEVPGSWIWANTGEALDTNVHPLPGDFFCSSFPGQQFGHVGIVVDFNEETQLWKWVAGGQGGKATSPDDIDKAVDYIRWGPWLPTHARTFLQARPKVVGWVDIGCYFFPPSSEDD